MNDFFIHLGKQKEELNKKRPFAKESLHSLKENLLVDWTYHSNAIEGNTLTLSETKVVLEGITVGGKTIHEHLEVINHKEAILYIEAIIQQKKELSEWQIKNIHNLVLKGIDDKNAGVYRKANVVISGARHIPPDFVQLKSEMESLIQWYNHSLQNIHPIERAARLHTDFVKIHPFVDGNGRTARLLLNFELIKEGYPPLIITKEQRLQYYQSLDNAHIEGHYNDFFQLVGDCLTKSFDLYMRIL